MTAEHAMLSSAPDRWEYWTWDQAVSFAMVVLTWYYLGFGYIVFSAAGLFLAWRTCKKITSATFRTLNLALFTTHSAAVIVFVFDGRLTPTFWAVWCAILIFNFAIPPRVWRRSADKYSTDLESSA